MSAWAQCASYLGDWESYNGYHISFDTQVYAMTFDTFQLDLNQDVLVHT